MDILAAKKELQNYSEEKVRLVMSCRKDLFRSIEEDVFGIPFEELDKIRPLSSELCEILVDTKEYWITQAQGLMTEEEFEDILALLDIFYSV